MFYRKGAADIRHFGLVLMRDFKVQGIGMLEWVHVKPSSLQWEDPEDIPFNNPIKLKMLEWHQHIEELLLSHALLVPDSAAQL